MVTTTQNKRFIGILGGIVMLLLIPFIAMQFSDEVNWTLSDFLIMGALLFSTGLLIEIVLRSVKNVRHRIAICLFIVAIFLLIWIELAVGVFGT